jgi:hypothetical protein
MMQLGISTLELLSLTGAFVMLGTMAQTRSLSSLIQPHPYERTGEGRQSWR